MFLIRYLVNSINFIDASLFGKFLVHDHTSCFSSLGVTLDVLRESYNREKLGLATDNIALQLGKTMHQPQVVVQVRLLLESSVTANHPTFHPFFSAVHSTFMVCDVAWRQHFPTLITFSFHLMST